jgi:predicted O-linked N-acetylglucosamine transferase (SPINDLY family)
LWCYQPYAEAPAVDALPAERNGYVTFACLNNPGKVSPSTLSMWRDILRGVPNARLILLTSPDPGRRSQLTRYFEEGGIDRDRIELIERVPLSQYLAST